MLRGLEYKFNQTVLGNTFRVVRSCDVILFFLGRIFVFCIYLLPCEKYLVLSFVLRIILWLSCGCLVVGRLVVVLWLFCLVIPFVLLCLVSSRVVVSCRVVSCRVMSCRVVSCRVVSCRVVSCRVWTSGCLA